MLQLIIGGAGWGKTRYTRQRLGELAREGERPILIVPEQYSFESERAILSLLGAKDGSRVGVYSFTRLAEEVARTAGGSAGKRLDDSGRAAVMTLALSQLSGAGALEYYKGKRSSYFVEHLLDAVKEFKLCAISPKQLEDAAGGARDTLKVKLRELALIYSAYDAIAAQSALDPMDDLARLADQLATVRFFADKLVYIDSFRGFTGQEMKIIARIIEQARLCAVTLCGESSGAAADSDTGLFATSSRTAAELRRMAKDLGVGIKETVGFEKGWRFKSEALAAVESSIFRYDGEGLIFEEPTDDVVIYEADGKGDELEFCARECRRLTREGMRCRDIAIIARDEAAYAAIAKDALEQQELPCFVDSRVDAGCSALMRFVTAALEAACFGGRTEELLRMLKTGMIDGISETDVAETENYCYVWRVGAKGWRSEFTQNPEGFQRIDPEVCKKRLARINSVRERLMELYLPLCERLESKNGTPHSGREMAAAVFELVEKSGAAKCMARTARSMNPTVAAEQPQIWDLLMSILDQLAEIFGDKPCKKEDFASCLGVMIKRADVGHIPRELDSVTFGGADRLRVSDPRVVFIVGASDGEFPAVPSSSGVFSDDERKCLRAQLGVPVAEPLETKLLEERLLAYNALCSASEKLYISYQTDSRSGGLASECVTQTLACVPFARTLRSGEKVKNADVGSAGAAFELYARAVRDGDGVAASLEQCFASRPEWKQRTEALKNAAKSDIPKAPGKIAAQKLFKGELYLSPSGAEKYHSCRYAYFCRYGLDIRPSRRAALDKMQYGTVAHYVLEQIISENSQKAYSELAEHPDRVAKRISELLALYLEEEIGGKGEKTASFLYRLEAMTGSLTALVVNMAEELSSSDFTPVDYELSLSPDGEQPTETFTEGGISAGLVGMIDRVDCCEKDGKRYIRVIDYKSGSKVFRLSDLLSGLNMQMVIYLYELCRAKKGKYGGTVPAGLLYCPAFSGSVSGDRGTDAATAKSKRDKGLVRNGMIIDDAESHEICEAMEKGLAGRFIPVKVKNSGEIYSATRKSIVAPQDFSLVAKYVKKTLRDMIKGVAAGELAPDPIKYGYDPCVSCDYYSLCRYDGSYRQPENNGDNGEVLEKMRQQLEEGE